MSANSLSKLRRRHEGDTSTPKKPEKNRRTYTWRMLLLLPGWVTIAFVASNFIVLALMSVLSWLHMPVEGFLRPAIEQTAIATLIYVMTFAIIVGVPYAWRRTTTLAELGLTRLPSWTDIGLAPVGFIVYSIIVAALLALVASVLPNLPLNQAQDIGFSAYGTQIDNILAFLTLVVIAPFAEELLFRGYLYGKLKAHVPVVVAALATSLLFALAHLQLNVGIDVFILSLVLCGLRSITGSIWAGVLVHVIKNALAYYLLFVAPLIGG